MSLAEMLAALPDAARAISPGELPRLRAALAEADSIALSRLVAPPTATGTLVDTPDENLSIEEAARRLGVSTDWLYRNDVPFKVRIGRRVVFSARGLERWNRARAGRS